MTLFLSGCLTTTHRMNINDLYAMEPDCANKEAQIRFLETQMTTQMDRLSATYNTTGMMSGLISALNGTYTQHKAMANREYDAAAKRLIWRLYSECP